LCLLQLTLMGTAVMYTAKAGKEQRDGVVVKRQQGRDRTEIVDCSSRRHVTVSPALNRLIIG